MVRKLRLVFYNLFNSSVEGALGSFFAGRDLQMVPITKCPMQSEWFKKFALGCLKYMGQVVKPNMVMTIEVAMELLRRLEVDSRRLGGMR